MNMALARLLSWKSREGAAPFIQPEDSPIGDYSSPAKKLERDLPEFLDEVDESLRAEFPQIDPPRRRREDNETDAAKNAPRWLLVATIGVLGTVASAAMGMSITLLITRQSEQDKRTQTALDQAQARADTAELQRIQKLETQMEEVVPAVKGLTSTVKEFEISLKSAMAVSQASQAEQSKTTKSLVLQLETLNSKMR